MHGFIEDLKSRVIFENFSGMVSQCTRHCVNRYDSMYLEPQEELCVKNCYLKQFDFQSSLNQELAFLVRNLWKPILSMNGIERES